MISSRAPLYTSLVHSSLPITEYFRRILNASQMDFEYAFWQMYHLCYNPSSVYQVTKTRKHIKKQWARDDPAFVVLLLLLMLASNIIHSLFFGHRSFTNLFLVILETFFMDFLFVTILLSSIFWFISNRYLSKHFHSRVSNDREQKMNDNKIFFQYIGGGNDGSKVEWLYAFDIHCNSYFVYFLISNACMILLTPLFYHPSVFSLILGNTIYLLAVVGYFYITFLGYEILSVIERSERLLYPLPVVFVVYVISMLTHCSIRNVLLHYHYGYHAT